MATQIVGLLEVEPIIGDSWETARSVSCDWCSCTPIYNSPVKAIYLSPEDGLYVCEDCVAEFLAGE